MPSSRPITLACKSQRSNLYAALNGLLVLGSAALLGQGCGTVESYRLSVAADVAPQYFSPIAACADQRKLTVARHPTSIHVASDDATWVQFMIQGASFNMVIVVDGSVPEDVRPARLKEARAKGEEIFACALSAGPSEAPPERVADTPAPSSEPTTTPTSTTTTAPPPEPTLSAGPVPNVPTYPRASCAQSTKACERDSQCGIEHCAQGFCYPSEDGCPCSRSTHCGAGLHCGGGYCYPGKAGTPCDGVDSGQCGSGLHCTKGLCYANATGAACEFREQCGMGSSCVNGTCN